MRVIAGTARSLPLKTPEGMDTRPTTDRIKETLFNMLQTYIPDCVFVDPWFLWLRLWPGSFGGSCPLVPSLSRAVMDGRTRSGLPGAGFSS